MNNNLDTGSDFCGLDHQNSQNKSEVVRNKKCDEPNLNHFIFSGSLTFANDDLFFAVEGQKAIVGSQESQLAFLKSKI